MNNDNDDDVQVQVICTTTTTYVSKMWILVKDTGTISSLHGISDNSIGTFKIA
jgi:hypothetical protein